MVRRVSACCRGRDTRKVPAALPNLCQRPDLSAGMDGVKMVLVPWGLGTRAADSAVRGHHALLRVPFLLPLGTLPRRTGPEQRSA